MDSLFLTHIIISITFCTSVHFTNAQLLISTYILWYYLLIFITITVCLLINAIYIHNCVIYSIYMINMIMGIILHIILVMLVTVYLLCLFVSMFVLFLSVLPMYGIRRLTVI